MTKVRLVWCIVIFTLALLFLGRSCVSERRVRITFFTEKGLSGAYAVQELGNPMVSMQADAWWNSNRNIFSEHIDINQIRDASQVFEYKTFSDRRIVFIDKKGFIIFSFWYFM